MKHVGLSKTGRLLLDTGLATLKDTCYLMAYVVLKLKDACYLTALTVVTLKDACYTTAFAVVTIVYAFT
jgi:hypothetical protein